MKLRKQIRGYEGLYEIRSDGATISMPREKRLPNGKLCQSKERVMSPARIGEDGYCRNLYKDYKSREKEIKHPDILKFIKDYENYYKGE